MQRLITSEYHPVIALTMLIATVLIQAGVVGWVLAMKVSC